MHVGVCTRVNLRGFLRWDVAPGLDAAQLTVGPSQARALMRFVWYVWLAVRLGALLGASVRPCADLAVGACDVACERGPTCDWSIESHHQGCGPLFCVWLARRLAGPRCCPAAKAGGLRAGVFVSMNNAAVVARVLVARRGWGGA